MIVHLDKEQTRQMRRKLLADNSDIVFILFHDILKELHKKGETQLSAVEVKGSGLSSLNFNNHVRPVVAHADVVEKYK